MVQLEFEAAAARHVAILTSPGMGHLIPVLEFAKRLIHHHNFSITCIIPTNGPPSSATKQLLQVADDVQPPCLTHIFIPIMDLPKHATPATELISMVMKSCLTPLREILKSLMGSTKLLALIVDLFSTEGFDIGNELNLPCYLFFPSNAMNLSVWFYLPELHEMVDPSVQFRDLPEPVRIPGCVPFHGRDLPPSVRDRKDDTGIFTWFLNHCKRYRLAKGIAVNSFLDIEPGPLKALKNEEEIGRIPPVFPVGPIIRTDFGSTDSTRVQDGRGDDESNCLKWLDKQAFGSVLFVSFGSGGTLSYNQLQELALGIELSGQRFLWVVRTPNDTNPNAAYFDSQSPNDPLTYLPRGFLNRTERFGLVVSSWAPQAEILSHGSTGGFLTHCGWNSVLESVANGIPLLAWPLYAEQRMNAVMLTEDVKIALRIKSIDDVGDADVAYCREEIAGVVERLMVGEEGKEIRRRMMEMKEAAHLALKEGVPSTKALDEFAERLIDE